MRAFMRAIRVLRRDVPVSISSTVSNSSTVSSWRIEFKERQLRSASLTYHSRGLATLAHRGFAGRCATSRFAFGDRGLVGTAVRFDH